MTSTSSGRATDLQPIYLRPNRAFLDVLQTTGTQSQIFTRQEIIVRLRDYITQHCLYHLKDPRQNTCDGLLKKAFHVDQFSVSDVLNLIAANTSVVSHQTYLERRSFDLGDGESAKIVFTSDTFEKVDVRVQGKRKRSVAGDDDDQESSKRRNSIVILTDEDDDCCKRKSSSSFSTVILTTSDDDGKWSVDVAWPDVSDLESCIVGFSDDEILIECYQDDLSERLSVQSKETILIHDLTDNNSWESDYDVIDDVTSLLEISINPYTVEYDIISDSDDDESMNDDTSSEPGDSENESESEAGTHTALLVVCGESDVEFFADYSNSEDDGCSDTEISTEDKWLCKCGLRNSPLYRYCQQCWSIRHGWIQGPRKRTTLKTRQNLPNDALSDYDDDYSPIPLQEAIIASLSTSEPITDHDSLTSAQPISGAVTNEGRKLVVNSVGDCTQRRIDGEEDIQNSHVTLKKPISALTSFRRVCRTQSTEMSFDEVDGPIKTPDTETLTSSQTSGYWSQNSTFSNKTSDWPLSTSFASSANQRRASSTITSPMEADSSPAISSCQSPFLLQKSLSQSTTKSNSPIDQSPMSSIVYAVANQLKSSISRSQSETVSLSKSDQSTPSTSLRGIRRSLSHEPSPSSTTSFHHEKLSKSDFLRNWLETNANTNDSCKNQFDSSFEKSLETINNIPVMKPVQKLDIFPQSSSSPQSQLTIIERSEEGNEALQLLSTVPTVAVPKTEENSLLKIGENSLLKTFEISPKTGENSLSNIVENKAEDGSSQLASADLLNPFHPTPSTSKQSSKKESESSCIICLMRPKNASLIHGNTGHQVCCYKCAKRLRRRGKGCPVCRRPIQKVIRNFIV